MAMLNKYFEIEKSGSTVGTEIMAGFTTFLTMSYIIFVNPAILKDAGMDQSGVVAATVLVGALSCILMGVFAKLPYGLAPGMGINAFFTYTMVLTDGISWQVALGATFLSGIVFLVLTLLNIRKLIVEAIPANLRRAIAAGIGLFIAFIGLKNGGIVVASAATLVSQGPITTSVGLFLGGLALTSILLVFQINGAVLIGIVVTTVASLGFGLVQLPQKIVSNPDFTSVMFKADILGACKWSLAGPIFTLLMTDMFDSISSFLGLAQAKDGVLLDKDGQPKNIQKALFVDSIATVSAGLFGSSAGTAYIESASGIMVGGRTGLTAVVVGLFFLPFLFLSNLAIMVPSYATAPALVLVGVFMFSEIGKIDFNDYTEAIPAFLAIILIPLTFSITEGIVWGFISYTTLKVLCGRRSELKPMMYVIAVLSIAVIAVR